MKQNLLAFWISVDNYDEDSYIVNAQTGEIRILETNRPMNTIAGEIMCEEDFYTKEKGLSKKSFWAKDAAIGPFKTHDEAVTFAVEAAEEELQEIKQKLSKFKKITIKNEKY